MATPVSEVVKVNWKQVFPWLALFRTAALALHVRQIFVGIVAAILIALGQWFLADRPLMVVDLRPGQESLGLLKWVWLPVSDLIWPLQAESTYVNDISVSPILTWWQLIKFLLVIVWGFVIGGLAGGILVRRTAFEFAREESLSLTGAVRFVGRRAVDYLSAPGLPLAAVLGLGLLLMFTGWTASWRPGGNYFVSLVWGVVWLLGIAMACLLVIVVAAWPMMIAAVSINGGDGFDALSRGFGIVIDRWRYYAWCAILVTGAYGIVCVLILQNITQLGEHLIRSSMLLGMVNDPRVWHLRAEILPDGAWAFCLNMLGRGMAYSFFWSSMTLSYFILRASVDNAPFQEIYLEGGSNDPDDLQALLNPQIPPEPTLLPIINPSARS